MSHTPRTAIVTGASQGIGAAIVNDLRDRKLVIPISLKMPLSAAAEAQAKAEKGGVGKILLVA